MLSKGLEELNRKYYEKYFLLIIGMLLFSTICFYYVDISSNVRQGINFWKALFEGNFFKYYSINHESYLAEEMSHHANYSMMTNFIMAIWQFPLYLIEVIWNINTQSYFIFRIYSKLYLLIVAYFTANQIYNIGMKLKLDKEKSSMLKIFFLTSGVMCVSVCLDAQIEIISLFMMLKAIEYAIRGDKKKFLIWYILSFQCKYFAVFALIPILLYIEKKIKILFIEVILPFVVHFIVQYPFNYFDPIGVSYCSTFITTFESLFVPSIRICELNIPLSIILYVLLCLCSFFKSNEVVNRNDWIIYLASLAPFCFINAYMVPYRMVMLVPLILILLFLKSDDIKTIILFETSMEVLLILFGLFRTTWCYDYSAMNGMLLDIILPFKKFELFSMSTIKENLSDMVELVQGGILALFLGICVYIFIIFYPERKCKRFVVCYDLSETKLFVGRSILCFGLANIYILFYGFSVIRNIILHFL